ncbi:MAG: hypothetical protein ABI977_22175 [Acidobacteriota bacterium]
MSVSELTARLKGEFTLNQAKLLAETINDAYQELVKTSDFNELKEIVRDLAQTQQRTAIKVEELVETQQRTEIKIGEMAEAQQRTDVSLSELAEAQKRTDVSLSELAEAQKRTDVSLSELAEAQKRTEIKVGEMADGQRQLQQTVGSLTETMGLSLENEAYRYLPAYLEREHDITVTKRMIRYDVGGEEIDFLAEGKRGDTKVLVVGESKTTLAAKHLTQLKDKVEAVKKHYKRLNGREIVPLMVVHRARDREVARAKRDGVIVAQSYEW